MSKFFIERPVFAMVISLLLVILGTLAVFNLPVAEYPQISPPTIKVNTTYIGANSDVVNQTVAQVIEQQVNGVEGMDYMSSTCDNSGQYKLSVVFNLGTVGDMDSVKVQNRVAVANATIPSAVQSFGVTTQKNSDDNVFIFALTSPNRTFEPAFIKNYADIYFLENLKRVPGVGQVMVFGSDYSLRVWLNPDRMAELNLTISEVMAALREQNVQAPAGTIGQLPAPENQEKQYIGRVKGRLETPEEFGNVIIRSEGSGSFIRLKDIARLTTGDMTTAISSEYDNKPAIGFGIQLTDDANAKETVAGVKAVLAEASRSLPPDLEFETIMDKTEFIDASINEVAHTFFEALILVMVIVYLFLQSWRATLVPMLAVPVSLIGTFVSFLLLGFTINTLTLFAMVLAIGLVVDDAIVVIENVEKHMETDHLSPKEATIVAMNEVQGPVIAIAFVLAAVFVPVSVLSGMTGVLYRQFALTIAVSMALSAIVALSLTPALCALILKPHDPDEKKGRLGEFFAKFNAWLERTTESYSVYVAKLIKKAKYAVIFLVTIVGLTGILFKFVPTTFVPDEDTGFMIVAVQLPEGTSMNKTKLLLHDFSEEIRKLPGVKGAMSVAGYDMLASCAKSSAGAMFVGLDNWDKRKTSETQVGALVSKAFGIGAAKHPEATTIAVRPPSLPGLGSVGGFNLQLMDRSGHTDAELDMIAKKVIAEANKRPELRNVYTTFSTNSPIYDFDIDRDKVKNLGLDMSEVFNALQVNFGGTQVNDFNRFGRTYKVILQSDTTYRNDVEAAKFVFVRNKNGTMIPLDTIIRPKKNTAPAVLSRFNAMKSLTIQGSQAEGYSSGQAMAAMEEIVREYAGDGFTFDWAGQSREEKKASGQTAKVLAAALIFVFLCLAALYESWSIPFAVLLTVPTAIFGALLSEYICGNDNSIYMQIGVIMLIGLAAKNAILIVEFAELRVKAGMKPVEAAIEAARLRLRPIIMTSAAFILGCLPLAFASGAGAGSRNAMGVAVVGGMTAATLIGIFLIPVLYIVVIYVTERLKNFKNGKNDAKTTVNFD